MILNEFGSILPVIKDTYFSSPSALVADAKNIEQNVFASGTYLSWSSLLSIAGIVFVINEFMEAAKLRNYIYRFGYLRLLTVFLVGIAIILISVSNLLTIFRLNLPLNYQLISEVLGLLLLSFVLLIYIVFLISPKIFLPRLSDGLLTKIRSELLNNLSEDNLSALSRLIETYLERIIKTAAKGELRFHRLAKEELDKKALKASHFIDVDLSNPSFVKYIAINNIYFIKHFFELSERYKLWKSSGGIFVDNLCEVLFVDDKSLLSKELLFGGFSGIHKPISNLLFRSLGILSHYSIFPSSYEISRAEVSLTTLNNWTNGLEEALKFYFTKERNIYYSDTPNDRLSNSIQDLADVIEAIAFLINKLSQNEIWDNPYGSKISVITHFFERLEYILVQDDPKAEYKPVFTKEEINVEKRTIAEGISEALFKYFEGFSYIKDKEYARVNAIEVDWLLYRDINTPIIGNIRKKVAELIKERFKENYKNWYVSMIKLMLTIYVPALNKVRNKNNPIEDLVRSEFTKTIAKRLIIDKKFRDKNIPDDWVIDAKNKVIYRKSYEGKKSILYRVK